MSSEKRKIAYIDGKPYEIGPNHSSILKFDDKLSISVSMKSKSSKHPPPCPDEFHVVFLLQNPASG